MNLLIEVVVFLIYALSLCFVGKKTTYNLWIMAAYSVLYVLLTEKFVFGLL